MHKRHPKNMIHIDPQQPLAQQGIPWYPTSTTAVVSSLGRHPESIGGVRTLWPPKRLCGAPTEEQPVGFWDVAPSQAFVQKPRYTYTIPHAYKQTHMNSCTWWIEKRWLQFIQAYIAWILAYKIIDTLSNTVIHGHKHRISYYTRTLMIFYACLRVYEYVLFFVYLHMYFRQFMGVQAKYLLPRYLKQLGRVRRWDVNSTTIWSGTRQGLMRIRQASDFQGQIDCGDWGLRLQLSHFMGNRTVETVKTLNIMWLFFDVFWCGDPGEICKATNLPLKLFETLELSRAAVSRDLHWYGSLDPTWHVVSIPRMTE